MKNFLRLIALILCVALLPLTAMAAKEADLNDGVVKIALLISGDLGDMWSWTAAPSAVGTAPMPA